MLKTCVTILLKSQKGENKTLHFQMLNLLLKSIMYITHGYP